MQGKFQRNDLKYIKVTLVKAIFLAFVVTVIEPALIFLFKLCLFTVYVKRNLNFEIKMGGGGGGGPMPV